MNSPANSAPEIGCRRGKRHCAVDTKFRDAALTYGPVLVKMFCESIRISAAAAICVGRICYRFSTVAPPFNIQLPPSPVLSDFGADAREFHDILCRKN